MDRGFLAMGRRIGDTTRVFVALLCIAFAVIFFSCTADHGYKKYEALVEDELRSGARVDSIFFGIRLGMSQKEFYLHCWEMNKKGLFTDGKDNTAVLYRLKDQLHYPGSMNFYPSFYDGVIGKMGVTFQYDGWAPWNKHMSADSLKGDVLKLLKKWYHRGNDFIRIEDKERGVIYVKVDGNRRIILGSYDQTHVKVDYTDLILEKQRKP